MKYTIKNMDTKLPIFDGKKLVDTLTGYAFIDEDGHCIIIVYGERKRDLLKKYMDGEIQIEKKIGSHSTRDSAMVS